MATMAIKSKTKLLLLFSLFLFSCGRQEQFETYSAKIGDNVLSVTDKLEYRFKIDDTLQLYDIDVFMRFSHDFEGQSIPLSITLFSPDGRKYRDSIEFNADPSRNYQRLGLWKDYKWKYRNKVTFPRSGNWFVLVGNASNSEIKGIGEISFILTDSNGKR